MAISKSGRRFSNESNFIDVVCNGYYVDKSLLIRNLVDDIGKADAMLFTRPKRFGKSLNLSMIRSFFEKRRRTPPSISKTSTSGNAGINTRPNRASIRSFILTSKTST